MVNRRTNVPGVMFGDHHSYRDYEMWFRERPDIGNPEAKLNLVDIPGADGSLDITEAVTGEVKYSDRTLTFRFAVKANTAEQQDLKRRLRNELHGKRMHIILDEDSDHYYDGRLSVVFENVMPWKMWVTITAVCDPYKYEIEQTDLHFDIPTFGSVSISPVKNTSGQSWNSEFLFGSPNAPTGDFRIFDRILIEWSADSKRQANPFWQVVDGFGHVENLTVPVQTDVYWTDVTMSALTSAGIDISKIYRILVSGIGDCELILDALSAKELIIENGTKTVVPEWKSSGTGLYTMVNGYVAELPSGYSKNARLALTAGENTVIVSNPSGSSGTKTVDISFRRGWL